MTCPVCDSDKNQLVARTRNTHGRIEVGQETFTLYRCLSCQTGFLGGIQVNDEYYRRYYTDGYYDEALCEGKSFLRCVLKTMFRYSIGRKKQLILRFASTIRPLSIIDIGCGNGDFLTTLPDKIFKKSGVEINRSGYEICQRKGINTYNQELHQIDFHEKKFDIITMWHVLEHVVDPVNLLKSIGSIMADDGLLVFQVPNADSYGFRWGKADWFHMDSPRHLSHFNRKSVEKLCSLSGFRIVAVRNEYYDYPLDLFWSLRKSPMRYLVYPFYPLWKIISRENLTYVCKKSGQ